MLVGSLHSCTVGEVESKHRAEAVALANQLAQFLRRVWGCPRPLFRLPGLIRCQVLVLVWICKDVCHGKLAFWFPGVLF